MNISISTIKTICDYLEISPEYLLAGRDVFNEAYLKKTGFNERQIKAVFYIKKNGKITNKEYREINNISKRTATNDLTSLVEKFNVFIKTGTHGAGIFYKIIGQ